MKWTGRIPATLVSERPAIHMDPSATILSPSGTAPTRTLYWRTDYPAYKQRAVRRGRWKYLLDDTTAMLFDLEVNIGERDNVAYQHPDTLAQLQEALAAWEAEHEK